MKRQILLFIALACIIALSYQSPNPGIMIDISEQSAQQILAFEANNAIKILKNESFPDIYYNKKPLIINITNFKI